MEFIATDMYKDAIKAYLDDFASKDAVFAEKMKDPAKSMDDCLKYIIKQAMAKLNGKRKDTCVGMHPDEVFSLAVHYYDEKELTKIEIKDAVKVVTKVAENKPKKPVRQKETLTKGLTPMVRPENKRQAKRYSKQQAKAVIQMDLFDFGEDNDMPEDLIEDMSEF